MTAMLLFGAHYALFSAHCLKLWLILPMFIRSNNNVIAVIYMASIAYIPPFPSSMIFISVGTPGMPCLV